LGGNFPNTPMLAAVVWVSRVVDPEKFIEDMEASLKHKFASKPHVIEDNLKALDVSMKEVQVG
jgi:pyruvate ferredoxin oxidoreductase gamma subunit